jgi:transcriptional regulator NrdR family protein
MTPDPSRTEAGVWCRRCGSVNLWVIQTSHAAEGVVRARRCQDCRGEFRSIEIYLSAKSRDVANDYPRIRDKRPHGARGIGGKRDKDSERHDV